MKINGPYNNKHILKYDKNNNLIYCKEYDNSVEHWYRYDKNNKMVHCKNSIGYESWARYDNNNREIYFRNSNGRERWLRHGEDGNAIDITKEKLKQQLYLNNKNFNRFELMDI